MRGKSCVEETEKVLHVTNTRQTLTYVLKVYDVKCHVSNQPRKAATLYNKHLFPNSLNS